MKYFVLSLSFFLLYNLAFGQKDDIMQGQIAEQDDWFFTDWKTYFYIDTTGHVLVKGKVKELLKDVPLARYDFGKFSYGLAYFRVNKEYGYMDTAWNVVIEPKYYDAMDFKGEFANVAKKKGDWFFIDRNGKKVKQSDLTPYIPDTANLSVNHPKFYIHKNGENSYDLIDRSGKNKTLHVQGFLPYQENRMAMKIKGLWGFLDEDGFMQIEPKFKKVESFSEVRAAVSPDGIKKGYLSPNGIMWLDTIYLWNYDGDFDYGANATSLTPIAYSVPANSFSEGMTAVKMLDKSFEGYIDTGGVKVPMRDDILEPQNFHNGVAVVKIRKKYGYSLIQHDGSLVSAEEGNSYIVPMEEPYVWIGTYGTYGNSWYLINTRGQSQGLRSAEMPTSAENGIVLLQATKSGGFSFYTLQGKQVCSQGFPEAEPFKNSMARVRYISAPEKYHKKVEKELDERVKRNMLGTAEQQAERARYEELRKKQCDACLGTGVTGGGTLQCSACGGSGGTSCSRCGGSGRLYNYKGESQNCTSCYGQGKKTCWTCGGSGHKKVTGFKCTKCNGTGLKQ